MKTSIATAALFLAVTQFHSVGATLDAYDSSTAATDSSNYTTLLSYGSTAETFAINGSSQLQPTGSTDGTTTTFLWKNNTFAVGDTLSIDIYNIDGTSNFAGLGFTLSQTSANDTNGDNYVFLGIVGGGAVNGDPATVADIDVNTQAGGTGTLDFSDNKFVTESVYRTATGLDYSFSGSALTPTTPDTTSISGTFAVSAYDGKTLYFGPNIYGGTSPGNQIEDNLVLVPEPSTYAMLLGGFGLLALVARGRKLFRA
jgi:hypothetical protein